MDFSIENLGGQRVRCFDSGADSSLQLVFLPGPLCPEIWRHQLKYFSGSFRTVSYDPSRKGYGRQKQLVEQLLEERQLGNAVLVSQGLGNRLAREMEYREEVVATVMTGARSSFYTLPREIYSLARNASLREPKLFKKLFFSGRTDYRVTKQFLDDIELPGFDEYASFADGYSYSMRKPVKNAMVIHAQDDRFSSLEAARELKPGAAVSVIRNAGTFSFYEKPQEYNKAVLDFLSTLEDFVERREVSRTREKNRSLKEFEVRAR